MKRILLILTAALLAALTAFSAGAEEALPGPERDVVLYLAVRDTVKADTARYFTKMLAATRKNADFRIAGTQNAALYGMDRLQDAIKGDANWSGNITDRFRSNVLEKTEMDVTDLWLLIPEENTGNAVNQADLTNWIRGLLEREEGNAVSVRVVMIGDGTSLPGEGTELGKLMAEYPERTECLRIASDFLDTARTEATREIHTGDYLIASRFGAPADLPIRPDENGRNRIELPEDAEIYVLSRAAEGNIALKDSAGNFVTVSAVLDLPAESRRETRFRLWKSARVQAGVYYVELPEGDQAKAYWYPNLDALTIDAQMPSPFKHGNNTVAFTLSTDYGRPQDFVVGYRYSFDGQEETTVPSVPYEKGKGWSVEMKASTETTSIGITPFFRLSMDDGNMILDREGVFRESQIQNIPVSVLDGAPKQLTLYLDTEKNQLGVQTYLWENFLEYNKDDDAHDFEIQPEGEEDRIEWTRDENGFTVTAKGETEPGKPAVLHLFCDGEEKCSLEITCTELTSLIRETVRVSSGEAGKTLKPGDTVHLEAAMDGTLGDALAEAERQGITSIPVPDQLQITFTEGNWQERIALSGDPEGWHAERHLANDETASGRNVAWKLTTGAEGRTWSEGTVNYTLQNGAPKPVREFEPAAEIPLGGFFGNLEQVNFLEKALGTANLMELFQDEETDVVSVTAVVDGAEVKEGLLVPAEGGDQPLTLIQPNDQPIGLQTAAQGEYQVTLTATDGVNTSEPVTVRVRVYSTLIRGLIFAGIVLALLVLILIVILIIRQARKPSFDNIRIRCLAGSDEDQERNRELIENSMPVPMADFGKKGVTLQTALILTGQPPLSDEGAAAARDILMLPTRHDELNLVFGKNAMRIAGRQDRKETVAQGNFCRIRVGSQNVLIENVR